MSDWLVSASLQTPAPTVRLTMVSLRGSEEHIPLTLDEAETLYYGLQKALREADVLANTPRTGLNLLGFGGNYITATNFGEETLRVTWPSELNVPPLVLTPRQSVTIAGDCLRSSSIALHHTRPNS